MANIINFRNKIPDKKPSDSTRVEPNRDTFDKGMELRELSTGQGRANNVLEEIQARDIAGRIVKNPYARLLINLGGARS